MPVAEKRLVPTTNPTSPCPAACLMRKGVPMSAAARPIPWLMLFAISSPCDCSRLSGVSGMIRVAHVTQADLVVSLISHLKRRAVLRGSCSGHGSGDGDIGIPKPIAAPWRYPPHYPAHWLQPSPASRTLMFLPVTDIQPV